LVQSDQWIGFVLVVKNGIKEKRTKKIVGVQNAHENTIKSIGNNSDEILYSKRPKINNDGNITAPTIMQGQNFRRKSSAAGNYDMRLKQEKSKNGNSAETAKK